MNLPDDLQQQLTRLREQRAQLEAVRDLLGDAAIAPKLAELEGLLQALLNRGGGAVVNGSVSTGGGDFTGRDRTAQASDRGVVIGGNASGVTILTGDGNKISVSADQVEPLTLLHGYYRSLAEECRRLPLGSVDPRFVQPGQTGEVSLADVYTDLDVVAAIRSEDEAQHRWGLRLARGEGGERLPLLEAIAADNATRVTLLGDAGSGKTTFVNYLSYRLAQGIITAQPPPLPAALRQGLLVRLVLRNVVRCLPLDATQGSACVLWDALRLDIGERLGQAAASRLLEYLQSRLLQEGGLILLDGLDEVPEAARRRQCLLESVQDLAASLPPHSRLLLTARPYAYADPRWQLPGFQLLALAPFRREQVEQFITHWHQAVRASLGWDTLTASSRARHLSQALFQKPYLADLASRPLLLTLMATLDSSWGQLPDDRADLYEESVKLLLSRWQQQREVRGPDGQLVQEPGIARALSLGERVIRSALEQLAFQMHRRQGSEAERVDAPADIRYGDVVEVFTPLLPDNFNAEVLLRYLEHRAGLLLGRREGVYAFPHRSFQEYLAACHLANTEPEFAVKLKERVWQDLSWWREVFLLGVGKKRQGGLSDAINVLNILIPLAPADTDPIETRHWQTAALAGEALLELRVPVKDAAQPHYQAILKRLQHWLRQLLDTGQLPPRERLVAGDVLGRLSDPRPGLNVIKKSGLIVPDIDWVEIPAGPFTMGSEADDKDAYDNEKPAHKLTLPTFHISRYPITNAQYRPFVEAGGYEERQWWSEAGWAWRQGAEADLSAIDDEDLRKRIMEWLAQRPKEKRDRPFWWDEPPRNASTRPVVGITWHEALAYCRWLEARLREAGKLPVAGRVQLPSEAEWEKAARGPQAYRWPWGNDWREDHANTAEVELKETSSVGLFAAGASPYGVQDMAGNVWEWTRSGWGRTSIYKPDYGYPYDPNDGRESLQGPDLPVVRGGSWFSQQGDARAASRARDAPGGWDDGGGFRVVLSLANSEF